MNQAVVRVGILGAANIARAFINGVKPSSRVVVAAVASRAADKEHRNASPDVQAFP